jgi:hypothetical protein
MVMPSFTDRPCRAHETPEPGVRPAARSCAR